MTLLNTAQLRLLVLLPCFALGACSSSVDGSEPQPAPLPQDLAGCLPDGSGQLETPDWQWGNEINCSAVPVEGATLITTRLLGPDPFAFQGFRFRVTGFVEGQLADDLPAVVTRDMANYDWATWTAEEGCTLSIVENTLLEETAEGRVYRVSGAGACTLPFEPDGFYATGAYDLPTFSFTVRAVIP